MTQTNSPEILVRCPSAEDLERYANGWMDEPEFERADLHISSCDKCGSALEATTQAEDSLTDAIRHCSADLANSTPNSEVAAALDTARGFMDDTSPLADGPPPVQSIGAYDLLEPLGHGGMGAVYLGKHRELQKQVAIKLLPLAGHRHEEAKARFSREVLAVGSLDDPRIVAATDAGETNGTRYLVMEHVSGLDLSRLVRHVGRLSIADACAIAREIALGLSTAHAAGVVHRDVKPSNVMLDDSGRVKILDFGLAQLGLGEEASFELTTVGQLLGTLDYMAPEQADRGGVVDYRADLYSLGATLFRLLAGRAPLAAAPNQSPLQKLRLLANHAAPKLSSLREGVPAELVALVDQLLDRQPENRPASAAHVAEQLQQFCSESDPAALIARAKQSQALNLQSERTMHTMLAPVDDGDVRTPSRIGTWLGRAAVAMLAMAGLFLLIDTQKGRVVIESDVADVQVRIVKDGQEVDSLKVRQGAESTKLWAGKYEVVIDSPTEDMVVEGGSFILKRGDVVVARISTKQAADKLPTPIESLSVDPSSPTYRDKTLDQWMAILKRERDLKSVLDCLGAVKRLYEPEKANEITNGVLIALKSFDTNAYYESGNRISLDDTGFRVLRKANPGSAYFQFLLSELKVAEGEWLSRLMREVNVGADDDWTALRRHLLGLVGGSVKPASDAKIETVARFLVSSVSNEVLERPVRTEINEALIGSPILSHDWWMALGPRHRRDFVTLNYGVR